MRIVIILDRGVVRQVVSDQPRTAVVVLDYDLEGLPAERITLDPDGEPCFRQDDEAETDPNYINRVFASGETLTEETNHG